MALGKRQTERQADLFLLADQLPRSPGHVFYQKLNGLLAEAGFDPWAEELCKPFYADDEGRPGIPPGTYFRMLLVGYFEGIGSQPGAAAIRSRSAISSAFPWAKILPTTPRCR